MDIDPQGHCAVGLAVPEEQIEQSVYDVLIGMGRGEPMRLKEILWQICERFELAPSNIDLAAFEQQMRAIDEVLESPLLGFDDGPPMAPDGYADLEATLGAPEAGFAEPDGLEQMIQQEDRKSVV